MGSLWLLPHSNPYSKSENKNRNNNPSYHIRSGLVLQVKLSRKFREIEILGLVKIDSSYSHCCWLCRYTPILDDFGLLYPHFWSIYHHFHLRTWWSHHSKEFWCFAWRAFLPRPELSRLESPEFFNVGDLLSENRNLNGSHMVQVKPVPQSSNCGGLINHFIPQVSLWGGVYHSKCWRTTIDHG
jgi:hypothetical protein